MNEETPGKCLRQMEQIWFRLMLFNATFNNISFYIVVVSLIVGENQSTKRKPQTCRCDTDIPLRSTISWWRP